MVEDYRAGLTVDRQHDLEDRMAGRRVQCPTLCLWSTKDDVEEPYGNPIDVWRPWVSEIEGLAIDSGHHVAQNPVALAEALKSFLK